MTGVRRTLYGATSLRHRPPAPVGGGSFASDNIDHAPVKHLRPPCIALLHQAQLHQHDGLLPISDTKDHGPIFAASILEERVATRQHRSNCADRCAKAWVKEAERHKRDPDHGNDEQLLPRPARAVSFGRCTS
jgi:hypothetical protein